MPSAPPPSRRRRALLLAAVLCCPLAGPAAAVDVTIVTSAPGTSCPDVAEGTGTCEIAASTQFDVVWQLDSQQSLNGYDLEIRWDASELTLISATPLYPDTGSPVPFLEEPSNPDASSAVALSVVALDTTQLFSLRFEASPGASPDGPDLSWFANGNGLSPASVVLLDPGGGAWDFYDASGMPVVPVGGGWLLAAALLVAGGIRLRLVRP